MFECRTCSVDLHIYISFPMGTVQKIESLHPGTSYSGLNSQQLPSTDLREQAHIAYPRDRNSDPLTITPHGAPVSPESSPASALRQVMLTCQYYGQLKQDFIFSIFKEYSFKRYNKLRATLNRYSNPYFKLENF